MSNPTGSSIRYMCDACHSVWPEERLLPSSTAAGQSYWGCPGYLCKGTCHRMTRTVVTPPTEKIEVRPWVEINPSRKGDWLIGAKARISIATLSKWWRRLRGKA